MFCVLYSGAQLLHFMKKRVGSRRLGRGTYAPPSIRRRLLFKEIHSLIVLIIY